MRSNSVVWIFSTVLHLHFWIASKPNTIASQSKCEFSKEHRYEKKNVYIIFNVKIKIFLDSAWYGRDSGFVGCTIFSISLVTSTLTNTFNDRNGWTNTSRVIHFGFVPETHIRKPFVHEFKKKKKLRARKRDLARLARTHTAWTMGCTHTVASRTHYYLLALSVFFQSRVCLGSLFEKRRIIEPRNRPSTLARSWLFYYTSFHILYFSHFFFCFAFAFASHSLPLNHVSTFAFVYYVCPYILFSLSLCIVFGLVLYNSMCSIMLWQQSSHSAQRTTEKESIIINMHRIFIFIIAMYEHFLPYVCGYFFHSVCCCVVAC